MKQTKRVTWISELFYWLMIAATAGHFIWCAVSGSGQMGVESVLLNVLPYGIPIAVFAWQRRELKKEKPNWTAADNVCAALFALSAFAMVAYVTVAGVISKQSFINIYFNVPLVFLILIALFGVIWMHARSKPDKKTGKAGKVLYALPVATLIAGVIHCAITLLLDMPKAGSFPSSSAPWWLTALLFALLYLAAAMVLCCTYAAYRFIKRKKKRK